MADLPHLYADSLEKKWKKLLAAPLPQPHWAKEDYLDPNFDVEQKVMRLKELVEQNQKKNKEEIMECTINDYINEIWISESPPAVDLNTLELITLMREEKKDEFLDHLSHRNYGNEDARCKLWNKLKNLDDACEVLFGADPLTEALSTNLARRIHQIVGRNLINDAGSFRQKMVSAVGSSVVYAKPDTIPKRLDDLMAFVKKNVSEDLKTMLYLGSLFFSEFLLIHPFSNGNGRTARFLLSHLLRNHANVPISLYLRDRKLYLDVLESRTDPLSAPTMVVVYMVFCAYKTASAVYWYLLK